MSRVKQIDRIERLESMLAGFIGSQTATVPQVAAPIAAPTKVKPATDADDALLPATPKMTWALKMAAFSVAKVLGVEDAAKVAALDFRHVPVQRGECVEVIKSSMKAKNGTANQKLAVAGELVALYNVGLRRAKQLAGK
jgi:hypothetical protein